MNKQTNTNHFYDTRKINDLYRVPLLEPIELISADEDSWFLAVNSFKKGVKRMHVEAVGITDSILVGYVSSVYLDSKMTKAWYVIDYPEKKIEYFTDSHAYQQEIAKKGIVVPLVKAVDFYTSYWKQKAVNK